MQIFLSIVFRKHKRKSFKVTKQMCTGIRNTHTWLGEYLRATRNTKLQNFQFKYSHRITVANSFLFKCGLSETELCTFCTETKESLLHLFWECTYIYSKRNWFSLVNVFKNCGFNMQYINAPNIILGIMNPLDPDNLCWP